MAMKTRSAIKTDLFASDKRRDKIDRLGDPLTEIGTHIDFTELASEVDRVAPRPVSTQGVNQRPKVTSYQRPILTS